MRHLVKKQYGVSYGKRQMQRILRQLGLYCYKPQPRDFRQPDKADEKLKERLRAVSDALGLQGKDLERFPLALPMNLDHEDGLRLKFMPILPACGPQGRA